MQRSFQDVAIQLSAHDNVAVAKHDLAAETILSTPMGKTWTLKEQIPVGHKFALQAITASKPVLRYGYMIGIATQSIQTGEWVHTHNLSVGKMNRDYAYRVVKRLLPQAADRTFMGYVRADGRVGTRNYIAVIATVNCSAHVTTEIARAFTPERLRAFPNVEGVIPLVHHSGCSSNPADLSHLYLHRTLANIVRNSNMGDYVLVGLGCEGNSVGDFCASPMANSNDGVSSVSPVGGTGMIIQDEGGFRKTVAAGIAAIDRMLPKVNAYLRTPQPISKLSVGLQCGGSDSWSGITANPLVGMVVDKIVQAGGVAVLAETPEIFGAEHLLLQRVARAEVAQRLIRRIEWWNDQAARHEFTVDNNPSPGNKRGGLTTIFEKALGAVAKGGSTPLNDVYEYAEYVTDQGLVFMDTPGYDPVSATGQVAGGCNLLVFTTGRGSVYSGNVAPCIKVASNRALFAKMSDDMDFDAGTILEGEPMPDAADRLLDLLVSVASGERTRSEEKGLPDCEFVPWQPGPVL